MRPARVSASKCPVRPHPLAALEANPCTARIGGNPLARGTVGGGAAMTTESGVPSDALI